MLKHWLTTGKVQNVSRIPLDSHHIGKPACQAELIHDRNTPGQAARLTTQLLRFLAERARP